MISMQRGRLVSCTAIAIVLGIIAVRAADPPNQAATGPRRAVEPIAPVLPGELVAALQEEKFPEALALLERRSAAPNAKPEDKSYDALLRGIVERRAGRLEEARKTLSVAIESAPASVWSAKLRSELANVEIAAGRFEKADGLARSQAEHLLADARKDRLASIYQVFAQRLLQPAEPTVKPDYAGAFALLSQARELAKSQTRRAELLLKMAIASQGTGDAKRTAALFESYVKEYPQGPGRFEARHGLAQAQMALGQPPAARLTWTDLARDLEKADAAELTAIRAKALFGIAQTHGFPQPPTAQDLSLGAAALERLIALDPANPLATQAGYDIGAAFAAGAKSDDAVASWKAFIAREIASGRKALASGGGNTLVMEAHFQIAKQLAEQQKFDEAIAAFKDYLTKFPDGRHGAEAQREILDARLAKAEYDLAHERHDQARAALNAFVTDNPLDQHAAGALAEVVLSFAAQSRWEDAFSTLERLVGRFPESEAAKAASVQLLRLVIELPDGDPLKWVERFRRLAKIPNLDALLANLAAEIVHVETPRVFRSGEDMHLKITTRNMEKLTFSAYKLNPEAYFLKKHSLDAVEKLDIGLVAPDVEWAAEIPGRGKYKTIKHDYPLNELKSAGVFVVKVSSEKSLQATTLVIRSDLDAIVKFSRDQALVFAQDMKTGAGRPGARVLIAEGESILLEGKTGADGVLLKDWQKPRTPGAALRFLVLDGPQVAASGMSLSKSVAQGLSAKAYLYTDRPAYRPGQTVQLRGVIREIVDGQYSTNSKAVYQLEVTDGRGRKIARRPVTLSEFGTFQATIPLDHNAPAGDYRARVYQPGKSDFGGNFVVQSYSLQKIDLAIEPSKTVYYRGETIKAEVVARYQYGSPLANRAIVVHLPDGRTKSGSTNAEGKFPIEFSTENFAEEQSLRLVAELPQDNVAAAAQVQLAVFGFRIDLNTSRRVFLDGESFPLRVTTLDARGEPVAQNLSVAVLKSVEKDGETNEREVARLEAKTDPKTGVAVVPIRIVDEDGGEYALRVSGRDQFGHVVTADHDLTISGKKDESRLRLLSDRATVNVGETASVRLFSRGAAGTALISWEADRILRYQIAPIKEGENELSWRVESSQFPNFTLSAARMDKAAFDEAALNLEVDRELRVTIAPTKPKVGPGDPIDVDISAVDQLGQPVAAELSLALVDRSLLRQFSDKLPAIGAFFHSRARVGAFATAATNGFSYAGETTSIPGAVLEDRERSMAELGDLLNRNQTYSFMARNVKPADVPINGAVVAQAPAGEPGVDFDSKVAELARRKKLLRSGAVGQRDFEDIQRLEKEITEGWAARGYAKQRKSPHYGLDGAMPAIEPASAGIPARTSAESRGTVSGLAARGDPNYFARLGGEAVASGRAGGGRAPNAQDAPPREQFVETAYWNPSVVTSKDGKARVTFKAPMALSEYRFTARGVTGSDTLAGQATAELAVRKDFFVDLKVPSILTQGDKPRFTASIHHTGVTGKLEIKLVAYAGGRQMTYPKTIEVKGDGIEEVVFEPFDVPDSDNVRLALSAKVGESSDEMVVEIPVRPWGVQAFASASGATSDDATVFVSLPRGRTYESPEMLIVVSPTTRRMLIELALGQDFYPLGRRVVTCILPPPANTIADRASDLLAATAASQYLRATKAGDAPEAGRLADRIQGLVSELVTLQNDDGGWPWVVGAPGQPRPSDRMTSARVLWALASAQPLGMTADTPILDKATAYLTQEFAKVDGGDHETRAAILHALGTLKKASFEQANALNRERQNLSDVALAYLALTLADLDRASLANEVLGVLVPRAKTEPAAPGFKPRRYWDGQGRSPIVRGPVEATALASLALARVRPQDEALDGAVEWLQAHRLGTGWQPHKAKGPAIAALSVYYAKGQTAEDRYRLIVTVNDEEVYKADIAGSPEGKAISVPRKALKPGDANRVRFDIEGRGRYGYAVTMTGFTRDFGPDQDQANKSFVIGRRVYFPAEPEFEGRTLPTGFGVAVNPAHFENTVTQVALGGRARVQIDAWRNEPAGRPAWEREFLVLEEHLPAGATVVEGSVQSQASHYETADGVLTFYFAPNQHPGGIRYDVYGYLPGQYRVLPPRLRSAYEPGRQHMGPAGDLRVLSPGEKSSDPYKPTPDELYARGKALYDSGQLAEAAEPLESLWGGYTLRDDIARDAARMLLYIHIKDYNPRKVVQYFEILKEKAPDLVIPFDDIRVVGRAYGDIGEHERAYLVWRAVAEASYLEDARVGEVLRQRGQTLEGIAMLLDLWREHPNSASIESDFFGLSQLLASLAGKATTEPNLRRELATAGVTKSDLLLQAIRLTQVFLSQSPKNPLADEASLALVGDFLELEDYDAVVKLSARYAQLYPKSTLFDSFQYSEALGQFYLGKYDRAIELAEAIAKATYKDPNGADQPSPNKWQALYILGQIYDARRKPAQAISYYEKVAEQFSDAADAVRSFTRKDLKLPEVSVIRPGAPKVASRGGGGVPIQNAALRNPPAGPAADEPKPEYPDHLELNYRNIAEVDVKVYPVDLMRLYLTRRNLDGIAGIDLAGITPLLEKTIKLGDGADFQDKLKALDLPLEKEGAYLVMIRGENLYASGIVLVSPLKLEVAEEPGAGRVRVTVRDARTGELRPKVQVKVIGGDNPSFFSGESDLRGVFVAEGVRGQVTAVARKGAAQYAFHRGTTYVGKPPAPAKAEKSEAVPESKKAENAAGQTLEGNIMQLNSDNRARQVDRLQQRYDSKPSAPQGVQIDRAR